MNTEGMVLLEYCVHDDHWSWHYNYGRNKPDTNGYVSIAFSTEKKISIFCDMMDARLSRRRSVCSGRLAPYTAEYIKKSWKEFCYLYNRILTSDFDDYDKHVVEANFDESVAIARLGNAHFSEIMDDNDYPWAWEYDALQFGDSNF